MNQTDEYHQTQSKMVSAIEGGDLNKIGNQRTDVYNCNICGQQFSFLMNMIKHKLKEHPFKRHRCLLCRHTFRTPNELKLHLQINHLEKMPFCTECGVMFVDTKDYEVHIQGHKRKTVSETSDNAFHGTQTPDTSKVCIICNTNYENTWELSKHMVTEHNSILVANSSMLNKACQKQMSLPIIKKLKERKLQSLYSDIYRHTS